MSAEALAHFVLVDRIPASGKRVRIEANENERRSLAEALGISAVIALTAELDVRPAGTGAFAVRGTLSASVMQTDVVTLEPVKQEVAETVDVTLMPAEGAAPAVEADERDVYRNGRIELGAIVLEHLALGLDPYPRAPGVDFAGHIEDSSVAGSSPFAALARLKRDND